MPKFYLGSNQINNFFQDNNISSFGDLPNPYLVVRGGTITTDGDFQIHTFTTVGTSSLFVDELAQIPANNEIEYLVIGGGGGGTNLNASDRTNGGCGGGAGEVLTGSVNATTIGSFNVIVGGGGLGSGVSKTGAQDSAGQNGSGSSVFSIVADPGEGSPKSRGGNSGNGFPGAADDNNQGGGGGGAAQGGSVINGGNGFSSSITGIATFYGGGGAAYDSNPPTTGSAGLGGGGIADSFQAGDGENGKGGGGGGASPGIGAFAGNGGSGVVILRYRFQN